MPPLSVRSRPIERSCRVVLRTTPPLHGTPTSDRWRVPLRRPVTAQSAIGSETRPAAELRSDDRDTVQRWLTGYG